MSADKVEPVDIAFLLEYTPVEVVHIKLPVVGAFEFMDF